MKAKFKNKFLLKCDKALVDAEKRGCVVNSFIIETVEELKQLKWWVKQQQGEGFLYWDDLSYEEVLIIIPEHLKVQLELTDKGEE